MHLSALIKFVAEAWDFDAETYPVIARLAARDVFAFSLSHQLHHATKAQAGLATVVEKMEHGLPFEKDAAKKAIAKSLIATLRAAELSGITAEELEEEIKAYFRL